MGQRLIRIGFDGAFHSRVAIRPKASAAASLRSASGKRAVAADVGQMPCVVWSGSLNRERCSRPPIRRVTVGCDMPKTRNAASVGPSFITARNSRIYDHTRKSLFMNEEHYNVATDACGYLGAISSDQGFTNHRAEQGPSHDQDDQHPQILSRLAGLSHFTRSKAASADHSDEERNQREVLSKMMCRNPEAFSSDLDVQFLMSQCPGDY